MDRHRSDRLMRAARGVLHEAYAREYGAGFCDGHLEQAIQYLRMLVEEADGCSKEWKRLSAHTYGKLPMTVYEASDVRRWFVAKRDICPTDAERALASILHTYGGGMGQGVSTVAIERITAAIDAWMGERGLDKEEEESK